MCFLVIVVRWFLMWMLMKWFMWCVCGRKGLGLVSVVSVSILVVLVLLSCWMLLFGVSGWVVIICMLSVVFVMIRLGGMVMCGILVR